MLNCVCVCGSVHSRGISRNSVLPFGFPATYNPNSLGDSQSDVREREPEYIFGFVLFVDVTLNIGHRSLEQCQL